MYKNIYYIKMESSITPENCFNHTVKNIKASQLYEDLPNKSKYTTKNSICNAIVAYYRGVQSPISPKRLVQERNASYPSLRSLSPLKSPQSTIRSSQSLFNLPLQSSQLSSFNSLSPLKSLQSLQSFQVTQSLTQQSPESVSVIEPSQQQIESTQLRLIQPSQKEILSETQQPQSVIHPSKITKYSVQISQEKPLTIQSVMQSPIQKIQQYQLQVLKGEELSPGQCDSFTPNNRISISENKFKQAQTFEQFLTLWISFYLNQICIPTYPDTFTGSEDNDYYTFEMGHKFIEMIRYGLIPIDYEITDNNLRSKYRDQYLELGINPNIVDDVQWGYVIAFVPKNILMKLSNSLNTYDNIISIYIELDTGNNNLQQVSNNEINFAIDQEMAIEDMNRIREWLNESVKSIFNVQNYGFIGVWNTLATSPSEYVFNMIIRALQSV